MTTATPVRRVLVVEDNPGDARLLREMLREDGRGDAELTYATTMREAEAHLAAALFDLILLDLGLPDAAGLSAVRRAHAAAPGVPLVVLTGNDDEVAAGLALHEGAQDYLIKGQIEWRGLLRSIRYATERKAMEEALLAEKERAQVTLDCIGDAVACTDMRGEITFLNRVAEEMTGWTARDARGRPLRDVFHVLDATSRAVVALDMDGAANRTVRLPVNCILVRRDGVEIPVEDSVAPILDRLGAVTGAVLVFRDVSAARVMALQMTHAAQHDALTGLPNRVLLHDRLEHAIVTAARHEGRVGVLFLDLDGFKHINDSLGHGVGDELLRSTAQRLVGCLRAADTVCRQGGDEFIVILPEMAQPEDGAVVARRILAALAQPHRFGDHELHVSASIGLSAFPEDGRDAETLVKNADTAMYQAKEGGRRSHRFFTPAMNVRAVERQWIEEGLGLALDRGELSLHYQPKVDLRTGDLSGAEALLRWTHPTHGAVGPDRFIPIAEASGLIRPIGAWVLREACRQASAWIGAGLALTSVAVNISAVQLREDGFLDALVAVLDETGLDPGRLELELTESVLMKHTTSALAVLARLRELGVRLALDDFGTGYSSLGYLRRFPIDTLKIDKSFVHQITSPPVDTTIVAAVVALGRSLGLRVVAEGVETREELAFLVAHGCDEAQGYLFSRPVTADRFAELLAVGHVRGTPAWALAAA